MRLSRSPATSTFMLSATLPISILQSVGSRCRRQRSSPRNPTDRGSGDNARGGSRSDEAAVCADHCNETALPGHGSGKVVRLTTGARDWSSDVGEVRSWENIHCQAAVLVSTTARLGLVAKGRTLRSVAGGCSKRSLGLIDAIRPDMSSARGVEANAADSDVSGMMSEARQARAWPGQFALRCITTTEMGWTSAIKGVPLH
jgi:hypothetical protein